METYKLTNETIDMLSEKIAEMYTKCGASKKETLRARLLLEEALIKYQKHFDEEIEITYRTYRVFAQTRFYIRIKAPSFDPFTLEENPMAFMLQSVMSSFESTLPSWRYRNLANEIVFTFKKKAKIGGLVKLGIAVAAAFLIGFIAKAVISPEILGSFVNDYVQPLSDAYAGLFCIMAVLLTFFAITLSIVHIGDVASAGALGGRILRRFFLMTGIMVIVLTLPILPLFEYGDSGSVEFAAKSLYDVLIGFIPANIVSPFLNFNSIHIMIIGAMFGFSLLAMGQKGEHLVGLFDECNLVAIYTNDFLNRFIYIYVGIKLFEFICGGGLANLGLAGKMVGAIVAGELLILVFYTVYICLKCKIPFKAYIKKMIPHFIVCLSSANFGAAFSTVVDDLIAQDSWGDVSAMALNMGSVMFRPACTLVFVFSSFFMAQAYGVEISAIWVVTAILLSLILVAAVPNIPGISVSVITLLYTQLGLPSDAIALMIAVNAPLQFLTVAVDTWCLSGECVNMTYMDKKRQKQLG